MYILYCIEKVANAWGCARLVRAACARMLLRVCLREAACASSLADINTNWLPNWWLRELLSRRFARVPLCEACLLVRGLCESLCARLARRLACARFARVLSREACARFVRNTTFGVAAFRYAASCIVSAVFCLLSLSSI